MQAQITFEETISHEDAQTTCRVFSSVNFDFRYFFRTLLADLSFVASLKSVPERNDYCLSSVVLSWVEEGAVD